MSVRSTGDYGSGADCPFCYIECHHNASSVSDINHESDCVVLIAKDLSTGLIKK